MNNIVLKILNSAFIVLAFTFFLLINSGLVYSQDIQAHVVGEQEGNLFTYTLTNNEPLGSPNFLNGFYMLVSAPIKQIKAPEGWKFKRDNSGVTWWADNTVPPYNNDIAPGASLFGFVIITSKEIKDTDVSLAPYSVLSWDHNQNQNGPGILGNIISPWREMGE